MNMKMRGTLASLALCGLSMPLFGVDSGYPPYPTDVSVEPRLSAPAADSPYAGPTLMNPDASGYGYGQPVPTHSWGGVQTVQQSMQGSMLNYQYFEIGYRYLDPKGGDYDGSHGLGGALVVELPATFFIKAAMNWTSGSGERSGAGVRNADYDLSTISVGAGVYAAIKSNLHFVGEAGFIYANFDADTAKRSYTEAGVYVRPSLRYQMVDWLELQAGVTVTSMDDYDNRVLDFGGYFRVLPQFDVNLGMDFGDQNRTLRAGGRLRW
jgi:hypothetical protein